MSVQTAVATVYDQIFDLLDAASSLSAVSIVDVDPGTHVPKEMVALLGVTGGEKFAAALRSGLPPQQEQFFVNGLIVVTVGQQGHGVWRKQRDRAVTIFRAVDTVIQSNIQLGLPNLVMSATVATFELEQGPTPLGGTGVIIPFSVHVVTYLT